MTDTKPIIRWTARHKENGAYYNGARMSAPLVKAKLYDTKESLSRSLSAHGYTKTNGKRKNIEIVGIALTEYIIEDQVVAELPQTVVRPLPDLTQILKTKLR